MLYIAVIKPFKALLRFIDAECYRGVESVLNSPEMAFSGIVAVLYVIDILQYTIVDDSWGIGLVDCRYYVKYYLLNCNSYRCNF